MARSLMIDLSVVPRCSCERSQIAPADSVTIMSWLTKFVMPVYSVPFCRSRSIL